MKRILIIISLFFVVSCSSNSENETTEDVPQQYELLAIQPADIELYSEYAASIKGRQDIRIIPRIEGYLKAIYVKEGEQVTEGQLLFSIDDASYRAAVQSAEANVQQTAAALDKAKLEYEGKKQLFDKQIISNYELTTAQSDLAVANANLSAAKAALVSARNELSYTELRSPSDGVIGRIRYRKGDFVNQSMQDGLTTVADNRNMRVYFSMNEKTMTEYLCRYKTMDSAVANMPELKLRLSTGDVYNKNGRVETISGIVEENTGAVSVCAIFDNADGILLSGSTCKIIVPAVKKHVVAIPQEATYEIQDKLFVYKVNDGKAVSTLIEVESLNDGKSYIVTSGLSFGDVIIAQGASFLVGGETIQN